MAETTGEDTYFELVAAVDQLRARGLHRSATWATEQLAGLATDVVQRCDAMPEPSSSQPDPRDPAVYMLAMSYFDVKVRTCLACPPSASLNQRAGSNYNGSNHDSQEYRRCAHFLTGVKGAKPRFLRCYAMYLAGEKRKQ
jgi:anaphase-promoting complex subunit 8